MSECYAPLYLDTMLRQLADLTTCVARETILDILGVVQGIENENDEPVRIVVGERDVAAIVTTLLTFLANRTAPSVPAIAEQSGRSSILVALVIFAIRTLVQRGTAPEFAVYAEMFGGPVKATGREDAASTSHESAGPCAECGAKAAAQDGGAAANAAETEGAFVHTPYQENVTTPNDAADDSPGTPDESPQPLPGLGGGWGDGVRIAVGVAVIAAGLFALNKLR